jgi:hypothetical protein
MQPVRVKMVGRVQAAKTPASLLLRHTVQRCGLGRQFAVLHAVCTVRAPTAEAGTIWAGDLQVVRVAAMLF